MKTSLLSFAAAVALLASSTASFAAPATDWRDDARREAERRKDDDRRNDRNDKDFNYGYDRSHKVTNAERSRWEAAHKNDRRDDRNNDRRDDDRDRNNRDDRNGKDFNYGYDRNHKVSTAERARWEAAHKNDRNDRNNGRR
ncbi:hypothetical protein [Hymenobacter lucidus]|uniref:Uncharacterized protein n=1 Tax=Hymenobacter lucidus TaxID=2880930 RepID=A0ABS8AUL7_9BACT|nr:hypothetical protein [Hymenobacter lucidus]MCB2409915.1 hypothetical protein [Hymenobacter lucidus]